MLTSLDSLAWALLSVRHASKFMFFFNTLSGMVSCMIGLTNEKASVHICTNILHIIMDMDIERLHRHSDGVGLSQHLFLQKVAAKIGEFAEEKRKK